MCSFKFIANNISALRCESVEVKKTNKTSFIQKIVSLFLLVASLSGCAAGFGAYAGHSLALSNLRDFVEKHNLDYDCALKVDRSNVFIYKMATEKGRKELINKCKKEEE